MRFSDLSDAYQVGFSCCRFNSMKLNENWQTQTNDINKYIEIILINTLDQSLISVLVMDLMCLLKIIM